MKVSTTCLLDDVRSANPELGLALYAIEPGGAVTLEVYTPDGEIFSFVAPTAGEAIAKAFPLETTPAVSEDAAHIQPTPDIFG